MKGILCFGDSITHGRGEMPGIGWVGRLKEYYESQDFYNCVFNLGIPGNTSEDMLERFDVEAKARVIYRRPDSEYIMTISVGTNDIGGEGSPEAVVVDKEQFRKNILSLISKAKEFTEKLVLLVPCLLMIVNLLLGVCILQIKNKKNIMTLLRNVVRKKRCCF